MELSTIPNFDLTVPVSMALSAATASMAGPVVDYATEWRIKHNAVNISNAKENIPVYFKADTVELLKKFNDIIVTVKDVKPEHMQLKEVKDYEAAIDVIESVINSSPSITQTQWGSREELEGWLDENADLWVNPAHEPGHHITSTVPVEGFVRLVPGDSIKRAGVSGTSFLYHWGIYIGRGMVVDILRYQGDINAAVIVSSLTDFLNDQKYPLVVATTISVDHTSDGGYLDLRQYDRAVTMWAAVETIRSHVYYSGVFQNCENYVNVLLFGENISRQTIMLVSALTTFPAVTITTVQYILSNNVKISKNKCFCTSRCGTRLGIGVPWCYVDPSCGSKKNLSKHLGSYYDECGSN
jgi:hypothetical protein